MILNNAVLLTTWGNPIETNGDFISDLEIDQVRVLSRDYGTCNSLLVYGGDCETTGRLSDPLDCDIICIGESSSIFLESIGDDIGWLAEVDVTSVSASEDIDILSFNNYEINFQLNHSQGEKTIYIEYINDCNNLELLPYVLEEEYCPEGCENPDVLDITTDILYEISGAPCSAFIDWEDYTDNIKYKIKYKKLGGNWITTFSNYSQKTITGLDNSKTYKVKVKAKCEINGWLPNWSPVHEFSCGTNTKLAINEDNILNKSSVLIYPNPAKSNINLEWSEEVERISIVNISGKEIIALDQISEETKSYNLDISSFDKGMYFVNFYFSKTGKIESKRLVKM